MLMRFDPFREFDRLTEQMSSAGRSFMAMDAYREGNEYVVQFDVPGIDPSSIDISVDRNTLTVSAERPQRQQSGNGEPSDVVATERPYGQFRRQLMLGESLNTDGIQASCENGVLTLRVPLSERAAPRKIEVGAGQRSQQQAIDVQSSESQS